MSIGQKRDQIVRNDLKWLYMYIQIALKLWHTVKISLLENTGESFDSLLSQ